MDPKALPSGQPKGPTRNETFFEFLMFVTLLCFGELIQLWSHESGLSDIVSGCLGAIVVLTVGSGLWFLDDQGA